MNMNTNMNMNMNMSNKLFFLSFNFVIREKLIYIF